MLFDLKTAAAACFLLATQISAAIGPTVKGASSKAAVVPNRYIVEFDTAAHLQQGLTSRKRDVDPHARFYQHLAERGVQYDVHAEYKAEGTFVGASVEITSAADLEHLSVADGVVNIYEVHEVFQPKPRIVEVSRSGTNSSIDASAGAMVSNAQKRSTANGQYSTRSFLPQIQADLVHRSGNTGQGIKIAIVDTGIDYNHPAFGGCFRTAGCRVQKGYDFVGDAFNGPNGNRQRDDDPLSACNFHGTSVAGCAAGGDNEYNAPGVAPGATIYAYRVFGCSGSTYSDIELEAMLRAESDGADIINFSISSTPGFSGSALGVAAANLAKKGIQCVWASGNEGSHGMFYAGSNGAEPTIVAAAAVDTAGDNAAQITFTAAGQSGMTFQTSAAFAFPSTLGPRPLYFTTSNVCSGFPTDAPASLAGMIVVVARGSCTFATKAQAAKDRGADNIFFVNNVGGIFVPSGVDTILANNAMLLQADGARIQTGLQNKAIYTVTFPQEAYYIPRSTAGQLASFSSSGPSYDGYYTSKIAAPGFNVFAPFPGNKYTITSGTSFASPITAGAVALLMKAQQNAGQKRDLVAIRDALYATAGSVKWATSGRSESAATVGSGLLQINDAINAGTKVTPTLLSLNDTDFFQGTKYISVTNTGSKANTYRLVHQPSALMYGLDSTKNRMSNGPEIEHDVSDSRAAGVKFSRTSFTLNPGQSTIVLMTFTSPANVDAGRLPIYSGNINILGGPVPLHVTYMGAATRFRSDIRMISTRQTMFNTPSPVVLRGDSDATAPSGQTFTFNSANSQDFPSVLFLQLTASRRVILDLVNANANLGLTSQYRRRRRSASARAAADESGDVERRDEGMVSDIAARAHSFGERQSSSSSNTTSQQSALLRLYCQYTNFQGRGCAAPTSGNKPNTYAQVPIAGNIFSVFDKARDHNNVEGDDEGGAYTYLTLNAPKFSNGNKIPNGSYKFLQRILRVNGDPTQQADYDTWVSTPFTIQT